MLDGVREEEGLENEREVEIFSKTNEINQLET